MDLTFSVDTIICIVGFSTGFFLFAVFIGLGNTNRTANIILAFLILSHTVPLGANFYFFNDIYRIFPYFIRIEWIFIILCGPLLYSYIKVVTNGRLKYAPYEIMIFILNGILIAAMLPFYLQDNSYKISYYQNIMRGAHYHYDTILFIFMNVLQWIFAVLNLRNLRLFNNRLKNSYSNIDELNLNWVRYMLFAFIICLIILDVWIVFLFFGYEYVAIYRILPLVESLTTIYLGFIGVTNQDVFRKINEAARENAWADSGCKAVIINGRENGSEKQYKSVLSAKQAEAYYSKLISFMKNEKPYIDMDLSLQDVSDRANISRNNISYILNCHGDINFYDFVNMFRIDYAKELLLKNEDNGNVLKIAFRSGFRSKSTFNKAFRKFTGLSPSEFAGNRPG